MARDTDKRPSKMRMALESVGENIQNLPRRAIGVAKTALTPQPQVDIIEDRKRRMREAMEEAEGTPGMKRGGKVKARGVGCAARGHGKGKMM